ncbi:hypothetical protein [Fibrobacter sp.]|uniref:hypothetical protein n=1 Tax=Fibrobacter sp. TaxID=35828 RepID=UPI003866F648
MKSFSKTSMFKTGVLLLPFVFAACSSDDSSNWFDRPDNFGDVTYDRHLARGNSAAFDCKVYTRENHVTLEMNFDVKMYESSMNTVFDLEVGDPSVFSVDVLLSGEFQSEYDVICGDVKDMDENMKTTCTESHVGGKVEWDAIDGYRASYGLSQTASNMESQCDDFYDYYKDIMSEMPGKWIYNEGAPADPAQSCNVRLEGDTLYVDAVFASRSFSMKANNYTINGMSLGYILVAETYNGVDAETHDKICSAYLKKSQISVLSCMNGTVYYQIPELQNGEKTTLEDLAVDAKTELCEGFLNGGLTLEDMWYSN